LGVVFFFFFFLRFECFLFSSCTSPLSGQHAYTLGRNLDSKGFMDAEIEFLAANFNVLTSNDLNIILVVLGVVMGDVSAGAGLFTSAVLYGFLGFEFTESAHHFVGEPGLDHDLASADSTAVFDPVAEVNSFTVHPELDTSGIALHLAPHDVETEGKDIQLETNLGPELMPLLFSLNLKIVEEYVDFVEEVVDLVTKVFELDLGIKQAVVEPQAETVNGGLDSEIEGRELEDGYNVARVVTALALGSISLGLIVRGRELDLKFLLDDKVRVRSGAGEDKRRCGSDEGDNFKELHV